MPGYSVPNCNKRGGHEFPRDTRLKRKWILAIKRSSNSPSGKLWNPKERSVVCCSHFLPSDYKPKVCPEVKKRTTKTSRKATCFKDDEVINFDSFIRLQETIVENECAVQEEIEPPVVKSYVDAQVQCSLPTKDKRNTNISTRYMSMEMLQHDSNAVQDLMILNIFLSSFNALVQQPII
uniref:uncharacterized protein LOC104265587 isoform X2 n=1 Tax=Ciona intestinalis TaxID=7719 RepID=UPI00089DABE2|nr:uncharacterized protein LOC104265587 isoform X2 [Ciona intestinalis]|eukprot:XP_018672112.1 uncharacterized protein LOC104265587 isoform X2 [Ciona intestinalis]